MLSLLATTTAFAPAPQRLLTATLAGGVMNDPNPGPGMHTGFISIDVKTGVLLHAHKDVAIGTFFRYL